MSAARTPLLFSVSGTQYLVAFGIGFLLLGKLCRWKPVPMVALGSVVIMALAMIPAPGVTP